MESPSINYTRINHIMTVYYTRFLIFSQVFSGIITKISSQEAHLVLRRIGIAADVDISVHNTACDTLDISA